MSSKCKTNATHCSNSTGTRLSVANDGSIDGNQPALIHVHVCIYCGCLLRREEVDSRQVASGISNLAFDSHKVSTCVVSRFREAVSRSKE